MKRKQNDSEQKKTWSTYTIFTDVWNNPFDEIGQKQSSCVFILSCKKNEAIQNDPRPSAFRKCQLPIKKGLFVTIFYKPEKKFQDNLVVLIAKNIIVVQITNVHWKEIPYWLGTIAFKNTHPVNSIGIIQ